MDATFNFKIVLLYVINVSRHTNALAHMRRSEGNPAELVPSSHYPSWNGSQVHRLASQARLPLSHLTGPVDAITECFSGKTLCAPRLLVDSTLELDLFSLPLLQCSKQALSAHASTLRLDQREDFSTEAGAQLTRREPESLAERDKNRLEQADVPS